MVVDIETTGLNPKRADLLEIGAVKVEKGEITAVFNELVRPGRSIPYKITQLTGITEEMVKDAALPAEVLGRFKEFAAEQSLSRTMPVLILAFTGKFKQYLGEEFTPPQLIPWR